MTNIITALYKENFIKAVILANKELHSYLNTKLSKDDYTYTNVIGYGGDNSLRIDVIAENIFIKHLEKFGNIYSEECGFLNGEKEFTIIIDPLDGSNNFYSNLPYYGTSIALQSNGITIAGFVTNLVTGIITYRAFERDIKRISLFNLKEIDILEVSKSKISIFERAYLFPKICEKFNYNNIKFRSLGAVALSLCDARNYDFVLYCGDIREFDIAAALYINKDLYVSKLDKSLLITKNEDRFNLIKEFIKE